MSNRAVVYRTAPNFEHKAAQELREAGARAYVARDRSSKRNPFTGKPRATAPGYVFSDRVCHIMFAKHVKPSIGSASKAELANLYIGRPQRRADTDQNPYHAGQPAFRGEIAVTVKSTSGRFCCVEWDMLGKRQTQSIHYTQLRPG